VVTGDDDGSTSGGALAGLTVVDLSRILAGPLCAQMLGDHGAEVIKVEAPEGDDTRQWGPPFVADGTSAYYHALHRNKRNVVLDLRTAEGQEKLRGLLASTDVLVENFKPGTLGRWGLADDELAALNPRLIVVRITGYGADGPRGGAPGYDAAVQAAAGLMSVNGEAGRTPIRVGVPIVDMVTGLNAFAGVLLALHERQRSGRGQVVDMTLMDTCVSLLHPHAANWFVTHQDPELTGSAHPNVVPYDSFPTADGPYFLAVGNDRQFAALMRVLGHPELAEDPDYVTNAARVQNRDRLRTLLVELFTTWTRADLQRALEGVGVPGSSINSIGETLSDPHVQHRRMVISEPDYQGLGIPIKLSRTPGSYRHAPRQQGADNESVLRGPSRPDSPRWPAQSCVEPL
jgi:crotonobetainyl-CoA:carnitine CoA-transferase CaiB-like acyl-CoA transferase